MPLIGNRLDFAIDLLPVSPSWEPRYSPERAAWAGTSIWLEGRNICQHVPAGSGEVEDFLFLPLGPLADWIIRTSSARRFEERAALFPTSDHLHGSVERWGEARPPAKVGEDEWLDAREEWWSRHFFQAGAEGAYLPNLAWVRADEQLMMSWRPPYFVPSAEAPAMLHPKGEASVEWEQAEGVLEEFTALVAALLREGGAADAYAWVTQERPLADPDTDLPTALEFLTGHNIVSLERLFDVGGYEEVLEVLDLSGEASDPGSSPACQILRDLSPAAPRHLADVIGELREVTDRAIPAECLRPWREMRDLVADAVRAAGDAIDTGSYAATAVRRAMNLDGQPIDDMDEIAMRCGLEHLHKDVGGGQDRMMVGLKESGGLASRTFKTKRTERHWGRRFETARALGHVLLDPLRGGAIGAASGPFAQRSRQQRSGVFAAELLLPQKALELASKGQLDGIVEGDSFERLLESYKVGAETAAFRLWDHHWLSSETVRDELVAEFAARD